MKKTVTLILALMLSFALLFCVGCGDKDQNTEDIVGKYYFYATMVGEHSYANEYGELRKVGEEFESTGIGNWTLSENSVVLEMFEDNTYKLEIVYGEGKKENIEGMWLKRVDGVDDYTSYENQYELLNLTREIYLDGEELIATIPIYGQVILKK